MLLPRGSFVQVHGPRRCVDMFLFLFLALDLTAVSRASVIFYSMPVWFAIMAHFGLPSERITVLHMGEVIAEGAPDEIQKNRTVVDVYIGARGEEKAA